MKSVGFRSGPLPRGLMCQGQQCQHGECAQHIYSSRHHTGSMQQREAVAAPAPRVTRRGAPPCHSAPPPPPAAAGWRSRRRRHCGRCYPRTATPCAPPSPAAARRCYYDIISGLRINCSCINALTGKAEWETSDTIPYQVTMGREGVSERGRGVGGNAERDIEISTNKPVLVTSLSLRS